MTERLIAIWTAVSSEDQAKRYSLDSQLEECRAFVESIPTRYPGDTATIISEISLADTRSIIEFSEATKLYPTAYGALETLIKRQRINVLVCIRRDRLGREASLIHTIEALCRRHKIKVVALKSSIPSTLDCSDEEGAGYVIAIEAETARVEIKRMLSRRESGMKGRVTDELLFPFRCPWGYSYRYNDQGDIDGIVMDHAVRGTIRRMLVDLYLTSGYGVPTIVAILNMEKRYAPRGAPWGNSGVKAIFQRVVRYAGWIEYNAQSKQGRQHIRVRGNYEAMITDEECTAIQEEMMRRGFHQQRRHNVLSGIVYCSGCGKVMYHRSRKRRDTTTGGMRCVRPDCPDPCNIKDDLVIRALYDAISALERLSDNDLHRVVAHQPVDIGPAQARLSNLFAEQEKLYSERRRAVHAYVTLGVLTDEEFEKETERIEARLLAMDDEIARAQSFLATEQSRAQALSRVQQVRLSGRTMLDRWQLTPAETNQWLRQHFVVVVKPYTPGTNRIEVRTV